MLQVGIIFGNDKGTVEYYEKTKKFVVYFPDDAIKSKVERYLAAKREFWIPESSRLDDYRIEKEYPKQSLMHANLALSELWATTQVWVDWSKERKVKE